MENLNGKASRSRRCSGCGLVIDGGDDACNALFQDETGRAFADPLFGRTHRMVVDAYCLQHPDRYCASAKSLAAHLCGLCELIERGGNPALPNMALRRWLDGTVSIEKPALPEARGPASIAAIRAIDDPGRHAAAVRDWAAAVWAAYVPLHVLARAWLDAALAQPQSKRHGTR